MRFRLKNFRMRVLFTFFGILALCAAQECESRQDSILVGLGGGFASGFVLLLLFGGVHVFLWKKCKPGTYLNIPDRGEAQLHPAREESAFGNEVLAEYEKLKDRLRKQVFELKSKVEKVEKEKKVNSDRIEEIKWKISESENRNARDEKDRYLREKETLLDAQDELDKKIEEFQEQKVSIERLLQGAERMTERVNE